MKQLTEKVIGNEQSCTPIPPGSGLLAVVDLANTTFVFGKWAVPGTELAKMLGLTEQPKAVAS